MCALSYIHILPPEKGRQYSSFYLYLPAGREGYHVQYRFLYEENSVNPALDFAGAPNDPSNRSLYRIREAYVGQLEGERFTPLFRALQGGEIGFAFRESGAGDFVGGFHGDEVLTLATLCTDGERVPLNAPRFGTFCTLSFEQASVMMRCNTPAERLVYHIQTYTVEGNTVRLLQHMEWLSEAKPLQAAYTPMLTVQRLDPQNPARVLTDTVEFYDGADKLLVRFDTTAYGAEAGEKFSDMFCKNTPARRVRVYGKESGFFAECGFAVRDNTIPEGQISASLCIRYGKCLDNKIYFDVGGGTAPPKGTVWEQDIMYRLGVTDKFEPDFARRLWAVAALKHSLNRLV